MKEQDWTTDKRKQLRKYNHLLAQTLIIFVNTFGGQGVTNIDNNEDNEDNDDNDTEKMPLKNDRRDYLPLSH